MSKPFAPGPAWGQSFRDSPYWLRFELGGEDLSNLDQPAPRLVQALTRSRSICEAVFAESRQVWAIVAAYHDPSHDMFAPAADGFDALSRIGFKAIASSQWNARLDPDDLEQDAESFIWRAFDITADTPGRDTLLWSSLTYEMPIAPKAPVISHFADFERGILVHIYDDRGMDVTALAAATLKPFYAEFDSWLLDYDRERMQAIFANL